MSTGVQYDLCVLTMARGPAAPSGKCTVPCTRRRERAELIAVFFRIRLHIGHRLSWGKIMNARIQRSANESQFFF